MATRILTGNYHTNQLAVKDYLNYNQHYYYQFLLNSQDNLKRQNETTYLFISKHFFAF